MAEIKIYGTLVNMTTDQKLALTRQLYDETLKKFQDIINKETEDNINTINESISSINSNLETIVVDNLISDDTTKALSAKQGKVLKSLIDAIKSFSIIVLQEEEDLPASGNPNTLYFKKKEGSDKDVYNEYIYIESTWELIGSTEVDLSNYYTKDQVYSKSEIDSKLPDSGVGDVIAAAEFTTENRVIVANGADKVVKDSGVLIENLALKSYVDEKEIAWDKVTGKPETYAPSEHKHNIADINDFPEIPDPIQVDSELSSSSENPVQNKVIDSALKNKLDSTALENYYNKEEVDSKISAAGGGNVYADSDFPEANRIIVSTTGKTIKESEVLVNNIALKEDINGKYFPITGGDLQGNIYPANGGGSPTGNLGNSTKSWFSAYVNNIHSNNISKINTASSRIGFNTSPYDAIYVAKLYLGDKGNNVNKTDEINAIVITGNGTKFLSDDGSYKEINGQDIPIALPNPYPLIINAVANIPNGAVSDKICEYSGESSVTANINVAGYDECTYEVGTPYLLKINGKSDYVLNGNGKWGVPHLGTTTTPGNYGICDKSSESSPITVSSTNLTNEKQSALIVVKGNVTVTFSDPKFKLEASVSTVSGESTQYKCYCLQYVNENLILVNCALYG